MRRLLLVAVLIATVACGAYHFQPGSGATGTVTGHVTFASCGPVQISESPPCATQPVAGMELDFLTGDGTAASVITDATGAYAINLAAGTWKVSHKTYQRLIGGPLTVTVSVGSTVIANYVIDSGMR